MTALRPTEVIVQPTPDQLEAWGKEAGSERTLDAWLSELADAACVKAAKRTWPVVLQLHDPVTLGNNITVDTLTLRRGKLGDLKGIKLGGEVPTEHLISVASKMSGQPTQIIEGLGPDDSGEVMSIVLDFFAKSLTAGK